MNDLHIVNGMTQKYQTIFKFLCVCVCVCAKCKAVLLITLLCGVLLLPSLVTVAHILTCVGIFRCEVISCSI